MSKDAASQVIMAAIEGVAPSRDELKFLEEQDLLASHYSNVTCTRAFETSKLCRQLAASMTRCLA